MTTHEKQYSYRIEEHAPGICSVLNEKTCDDPFIRTTIIPRGWKAALLVLRGKLKFRIEVNGTRKAYEIVFGSDYTPDQEEPRIVMQGASSSGV